MGRKGNKRRGRASLGQEQQKNEDNGSKKKRRVDVSEFTTNSVLNWERRTKTDQGKVQGEDAQEMPWTRWKGDLEDPKQEHLALAAWKEESYSNDLFEEYYKNQKNIPQREWPEFIGALRTPLPATFRLNARHPVGAKLLQRLQAGEFDMPDVKDPDGRSLRLWRWRGKPIPYTVKQVRGVPRSEAWQFGFDRAGFRAARKFALLAKLYSEMHAAESRGAAARQEVVSMLPALLLRPQAGERVLDMCASPGSKTVQLLEAVRPFAPPSDQQPLTEASPTQPKQGRTPNSKPTTKKQAAAIRQQPEQPRYLHSRGLVVANDADRPDRIPPLCQRLAARPSHERAGVVVTSAPGELIPTPSFPSSSSSSSSSSASRGEQSRKRGRAAEEEEEARQEEDEEVQEEGEEGFDRVLVDAPCSGDGTIRKAADILRRWTPTPGLRLHGIQLNLLRNALKVVKVGGTVVYSTCSFNPVENEAVVAAALSELPPGCCELGDVPAAMASTLREEDEAGKDEQDEDDDEDAEEAAEEGLKLRRGLRTWKVAGEEEGEEGEGGAGPVLRWHPSSKHARAAHMTPTPLPSMWPPAPGSDVPLERCARVLPHDNDTGGFFLALIHKLRPLPPSNPADPIPDPSSSSDLHPLASLAPPARARCKPLLAALAAALPADKRRRAQVSRRVWCSADGSEVRVAPAALEWLRGSGHVAVVQAGLSVEEVAAAVSEGLFEDDA